MKMFKVPQTKVLVHTDNEYKAMLFACDKNSIGNDDLRTKVKQNINRPYILIQEYVPGFNL